MNSHFFLQLPGYKVGRFLISTGDQKEESIAEPSVAIQRTKLEPCGVIVVQEEPTLEQTGLPKELLCKNGIPWGPLKATFLPLGNVYGSK